MDHVIYLSLGSNLGDRLANLNKAVSVLKEKIHLEACSSVYETIPWGYSDQPDFLNLVVKGLTTLEPEDLLTLCKEVEVTLGRKETFHFGPRLIDLDILFYDNRIVDTPNLIIPHLRLPDRAFVLVPLAEIAPDLVHPKLKKTIQELKSNVDTSGTIPFTTEKS